MEPESSLPYSQVHFLDMISKNSQVWNLMKIRQLGDDFLADRRTEREA